MVATRRARIPPPLKLEDDNTRYGLNLLQSRVVERDSDSFFAKIYETNWRLLILLVASINLIRFTCSVILIGFSFHEVQLNDALHSRQRSAIFAAVGIMYAGTGLVELFGIFSVAMRRLRLIRIYTHLEFISALVVTGTGIMVAFAYFQFAEDVVNQCISVAGTGKIVVKLIYRSVGLVERSQTFSADDAQMQCFNAWSSESSAQIISVFVFYFLPSAFTCLLIYTFYRQCTDPYHSASLCEQMVAGSAGHQYTRVLPAGAGYVSPYYSPLHLNVIAHHPRSSAGAGGGAVMDSRSSAGSINRRRSAPNSALSLSGRRSGRSRMRVNWFAKGPLNMRGMNSSSLSTATMSPGPPSYNGGPGHMGYAYEVPYGQGVQSSESEGKFGR